MFDSLLLGKLIVIFWLSSSLLGSSSVGGMAGRFFPDILDDFLATDEKLEIGISQQFYTNQTYFTYLFYQIRFVNQHCPRHLDH
jgi:hypothetical protein